jgi:hypothetical protein
MLPGLIARIRLKAYDTRLRLTNFIKENTCPLHLAT